MNPREMPRNHPRWRRIENFFCLLRWEFLERGLLPGANFRVSEVALAQNDLAEVSARQRGVFAVSCYL